MSDADKFVQDIAEHPSFERLRSEILSNLGDRARESQQAFTGLMTFCGLLYSGATVAILGFIGARSSTGVPYLAIVAFALLVAALLSFAICYQFHSQLAAARHYHYATTAHAFFTRKATFGEMLAASLVGQSKFLYVLIFWIPLSLACVGFICGGLGVFGFGPSTFQPPAPQKFLTTLSPPAALQSK